MQGALTFIAGIPDRTSAHVRMCACAILKAVVVLQLAVDAISTFCGHGCRRVATFTSARYAIHAPAGRGLNLAAKSVMLMLCNSDQVRDY